MSNITEEIKKRRTFAIISHPDAGKTTLTEKFLLYGGAINLAGTVKGRKAAKHAVSDWMEIEKERGISVTSSVMQFEYDGYCINILDTPGHQDFSEDTYRTLMAADSAVMVERAKIGPGTAEQVMDLVSQRSGKQWESAFSLLTFNIRDIIRIWDNRKAGKAGRKGQGKNAKKPGRKRAG